jgi:hypothetical protein
LLFLTPLNAGGIVAGKVISVALRAFTLWLAVLPVLVVPFLEGGINWLDASAAVIIEFCAAVLCLAAGLLATSLTEKRNTAVTLAVVFAVVFLASFAMLFTGCFFNMSGFFARTGAPVFDLHFLIFASGLIMTGNLDGVAGWYGFVLFLGGLRLWYAFCALSPLLVLFFAWMIGRFAARRVERSWQDKPPTAKRQRLLQRYCTPLFRQRFRRKMQRSLDWNPIAWLQQYSWKDRVTKWGLCLGFLVFVWMTTCFNLDTRDVFQTMLAVFAGCYTFVGVSSFLEEKRSGALELLLVTPLPVNRLIFGRAWGLWKQFFPAAVVVQCRYYSTFLDDCPASYVELVCLFLTLPVFATYFALRVKNLIAGAVLTWLALWLPLGFVMELRAWAQSGGSAFLFDEPYSAEALLASYGACVILACFLLRHSLSRRIYSF